MRMRAWLMDSYEGVGQLRLAEIGDPQPGPGQVLLDLRFASLNPADAFLAKAQYPAKPSLPHVLGRDGVGVVAAVGANVATPRVGETVGILRCAAGVTTWGTLAEKVVVPAESLASLPAGWSAEEMASAPLVFLTAWQALTQWSEPPAPPPTGTVTLVTGASGGVGVASVLLAKSMGTTVVALSRSERKRTRLTELGADLTFDPSRSDLRKAILAALAPRMVNLAIDLVAGELLHPIIGVLDHGGCISAVGRSGGVVPDFNTATLFFRRNRIGGVAVGDYTPAEAQVAWRQVVDRLASIDARPVVDRVLPFDDVKAGFARLAEGPMGKVLIAING
jgi:NADPH2:quinone reductase